MHLYNCKSNSSPGTWFITKFDLDLNVLASYHVSHNECECPRGTRPTCRHRKMLRLFQSGGHVDDGWFLDYETRLWTAPIATQAEQFTDDPATLPAKVVEDAAERPRVEPPAAPKSDRQVGGSITHIRPIR